MHRSMHVQLHSQVPGNGYREVLLFATRSIQASLLGVSFKAGLVGKLWQSWGPRWKYATLGSAPKWRGTACATRTDLGVQLRLDQDRIARFYPHAGDIPASAACGRLLSICWLRGLRMPREPVVWVHFCRSRDRRERGAVVSLRGRRAQHRFGTGRYSQRYDPLWTVTPALAARMERLTAVRGAGLTSRLCRRTSDLCAMAVGG